MKKQILIFAMFSLALLLAGSIKSFGQKTYIDYVEGTPICAPALPLSCAVTSGELNPTPGQTYTYEIQTDPTVVGSVHWFVTDANAVITDGVLTPIRDAGDGTGTYIALAEAAVYNIPANMDKEIDISWQWFDPIANEVLLVAYVTGAAGCSDNVEVWRIEPTFAFTLDVLSMGPDGSLGTILAPKSECVSPVEGALYDGTNLTMDYGENWVFFSVNAANFNHSWMPDMSAVITGTSTIGVVEWAYADQAVLNAGGVATGIWNPTTVAVNALGTGGTVGAAGECIVVRVEIQHDGNPTPLNIAQETVTLSIDGIMYDAVTTLYTNPELADVDEGTPTCVQNVTDIGTYFLNARPLITEVTPAPVSFEPKN